MGSVWVVLDHRHESNQLAEKTAYKYREMAEEVAEYIRHERLCENTPGAITVEELVVL